MARSVDTAALYVHDVNRVATLLGLLTFLLPA